jgi:uncharacterized membrane protein YdjX (TVP38/TMEM64 family)
MTRVSRTFLSQTFPPHTFVAQAGLLVGRSFWPLFAIAVIAGVMLWGPWVSLAITVVAVIAAMKLL